MSGYAIPWPQFTPHEIIMIVWFSVLGIELRDVARLMSYKLNRPLRTRTAIITQMDRINNGQLQIGYPELCTRGMADWNKGAVKEYLIRMTDDANLLRCLLWFGNRHLPLLQEYQHIPLDQVVHVGGMQRELNKLLHKHRIYWHHRSLYGRQNFY